MSLPTPGNPSFPAGESSASAAVRCVHCGLCLPVCPSYRAFGTESRSPRGLLMLIRSFHESGLPIGNAYKDRIASCLLCKACGAACPSGLHPDEIVLAGRAESAASGLPFAKRFLFRLLADRPRLEAVLRLGARFQGLFLASSRPGKGPAPCTNGLRRPRFPWRPWLLHPARMLPGLAPVTLYRIAAASRRPSSIPTPVARVAYFPGCMTEFIYPGQGLAVIDLLEAHRVEVVLSRDFQCCGTPVLAHGDPATASLLAARNQEVMDRLFTSGVEAVVTGCASCAGTLKGYPALEGGRVYDAAEFLVEAIGLRSPRRECSGRVAYHDPCHALHGQGVSRSARRLLAAAGFEPVEPPRPGSCCGGAGSFSLAHPEPYLTLNDTRIDDLASTGAVTAASACPSCVMHLADGAARRGLGMAIRHPVELAAEAYRKN
ncbi:MAG: (Fe-S)-binding protein [Firmicutes bacterium]|nr:(Fe-S)-binding protein [Bacillota bacterium]